MDLDVVATKDGKLVTDLTRAEITVTVDGKPVPLDYFTRVEAGQLHGPDLATASPDLILESDRAATGDRYVARQFLVFFDDEHLLPFDPRAVEGAARFRHAPLPVGPDGDPLLQHLDARPHSVHELEGGASRRPLAPREDRADGLSWEQDFQQYRRDAASARTQGGRSAAVRNWSQESYGREKGMLEDVRRALSALAARSGKRIFLYVSSGFEMRPGQSFAQAVPIGRLHQFDYTVVPEFGRTVKEANAAGITMYALDARGLTVDVDAADSAAIPVNRFFTDANRREGMAGFAEETGGQIFENRNSFKGAVDQIVREASSYYSIGVTLSSLPKKKDEHRIDVSTRRPGVVVRTRRSFVPKPPDRACSTGSKWRSSRPTSRGSFPSSSPSGLRSPPGRVAACRRSR